MGWAMVNTFPVRYPSVASVCCHCRCTSTSLPGYSAFMPYHRLAIPCWLSPVNIDQQPVVPASSKIRVLEASRTLVGKRRSWKMGYSEASCTVFPFVTTSTYFRKIRCWHFFTLAGFVISVENVENLKCCGYSIVFTLFICCFGSVWILFTFWRVFLCACTV